MDYEIGQTVRIGNRPSNQDRVGIASGDGHVLMVLADGLGGYADGELAAQTLVDSVIERYLGSDHTVAEPARLLERLIRSAHEEVIGAGRRQTPPSNPCTTCVVCLVRKGVAWWAHVGDSRLYLLRHRAVVCRTRDHSYVEQLYQQGVLAPGETERHPKRNYVTRCVGGRGQYPGIAHGPATSLQRGDTILLCSDGLWGALGEGEFAGRLFEGPLDEAVGDIAYRAEQLSYPYSDNISALALRLESNGRDTLPQPHPQTRYPRPQPQVAHPEDSGLTSAIREIERALEEFGPEMRATRLR